MSDRNSNEKSLKPLKWYKALATAKGRKETGVFLIEGDRAVRQVIASHQKSIVEILAVEGLAPAYKDYPVRYVTESQFKSICLTKTPQGPLAVIKMPDDIGSRDLPRDIGDRVLLLEDIQDPGNVGSLIRSAAAFGYSGAVMSDKCADPFSPKCVQSTAGAVLSLWIRRTASYIDIIGDLKTRGYNIVTTVVNGVDSISILRGLSKVVLALGNEAGGLSEAVIRLSDHRCRIPIDGERIESLNVAACGAICMYLNSAKS
ncbi:MAG: RNA methyltransferase [Dehalococcoidia bacterium]|jgi:TrmH family RNA methyltransferase